jgi:Holliday junction resolvase RusA-like endonuclease
MVTLDDTAQFTKVLALKVPWAHTWADMRPGRTDRERREAYRKAAVENIALAPTNTLWWAFRITVEKAGRPLDVDNVAKTIIDAFSARQILKDMSPFTQLGLYPDDTFDHVRILQVVGSRSTGADSTFIEVFACIRE